MRDFHVFIEQQGEQIYVGKITGSGCLYFIALLPQPAEVMLN